MARIIAAEGARPVLTRRETLLGAGALGLTGAGCASVPAGSALDQTVWTFDRLDSIGGHPTRAEGAPTVVASPVGPAVHFDGVDDALFVDNHPLAVFTFEAVFRPDGGAFEQRWLHLQEDPPGPDAPSGGTRMMFEIRVYEQGWALDAFVKGPGYNHTLLFPDKLHPVGRWSHVAQSFDGQAYRSYVDGVLQGEAAIAFGPQGPGRASVGTRINRVNYFNGAVREARFTRFALPPARFTLL
jgi:hypothetical protein